MNEPSKEILDKLKEHAKNFPILNCPICDGDGLILYQTGIDEYGDALGETEECHCQKSG